MRVQGVLTDQGNDISSLLNDVAGDYADSYTGVLIAESGLNELALREGKWPDYSAGLSQVIAANLGSGVAPIVSLLSSGGPPTVGAPAVLKTFPARATRVVGVIINTVNRMRWGGPSPHVSIERFERLTPALADSDSAPSPRWPVCTIFVEAPAFDRFPSAVLRRPDPGTAMDEISLSSPLPMQAAATLRMPSAKSVAGNGELRAAITLAVPSDFRAAMTVHCQDGESAKSLARKIEHSHTHHVTGSRR